MKQKKNVNERFLRQIWQKKIFDQKDLKTLDGSSLQILSVGTQNNDGGPDFIQSKLRIGAEVYEGDIEIHRDITDWLLHSHSGNPKYNNIILHVVLYNQSSFIPTFTHSGRKIPVLILENYLTKPLSEVWEEAISEERDERNKTIWCYDKNKSIPLEKKFIWLERLGYRRLEARIKHLEDRLDVIVAINEESELKNIDGAEKVKFILEKKKDKKHWEQLFYEGILEGLGYSKNREPFVKLSTLLDLEYLRTVLDLSKPDLILRIQAILFGVANLIPAISEIQDEETANHINQMNAFWNEFSVEYKKERLNKNEWQFFRLRPQNFPTLRIAGLSFLIPSLIQGNLFKNAIQFIRQSENRVEKTIEKLVGLFNVEGTGYWCTHFNFSSETRKDSKSLIGQHRIDDIIINTLIPIIIQYSRFFNENRLEKLAMSIYHFYPHLSENETSRIIVEQLLDNNAVKTAKQQQGAIHLYKFFCMSNKCSKCDVGKIIKGKSLDKEEEIEPETSQEVKTS
jgi:hypothetical protein